MALNLSEWDVGEDHVHDWVVDEVDVETDATEGDEALPREEVVDPT